MPRSRRTKRTGLLAATALIAALATLGLGYASWTQQLTIGGTVDTAHMGVQWTFPGEAATDCFDNDDGTTDLADTTLRRDSGDDQLLHRKLENGYPGYLAQCFQILWKVEDNSIPVLLEQLVIETAFETRVVASGASESFDLDGDSELDVEIRFFDGVGLPYQPGSEQSMAIWVEILDDSPDGETLSFEARAEFVIGIP